MRRINLTNKIKQTTSCLVICFLTSFCTQVENVTDQLPEDAIPPFCEGLTYNEYDKLTYSEIKEIKVKIPKSKQFYENLLNAYRTGNYINEDFKKKFGSKISIEFSEGITCEFSSEIRIHGDLKDHIKIDKKIASLDVKLLDGNILGTTHFKLFLPNTRNDDNEIFATELLERFGVISPNSFYVNVNFNDFYNGSFIFQEKSKKELIERFGYREGPIFEVSENYVWENDNDKYFRDISQIGDWHLLYASNLNQNWRDRSSENSQIVVNSMSLLNKAIYSSANPQLVNFESEGFNNLENYRFEAIMMALYGQDNYDFINHATLNHNRKFYFNPITGIFHPIYYDGMIKFLGNSPLEKSNLSPRITEGISREAKKLLEEEFDVEDFIDTLKSKGVIIDNLDFESLFKKFYSNLLLISKYSDNVGLKNEKPFQNLNKASVSKVFYFSDKSEVIACVSIDSCTVIQKNIEELLKINNNKNEWVFLGDFESFTKKSKNNNVQLNVSNFTLTLFNNPEVVVKDGMKEVYINIDDLTQRVLVTTDQIISGWTFKVSVDEKIEKAPFDNQEYLTGCITFYNTNLDQVNIEVTNSHCEDAVNIIRSKGSIGNIVISDSISDGLDADFSLLTIQNIFVNNSFNDCLDFSYGNYVGKFIELSNCTDKGVSIGEDSSMQIEYIEITNSKYGIAAKDSSNININTLSARSVDHCLVAYRKKIEFGPSYLSVNNNECINSTYAQKGSMIRESGE